jgi:transcriptional regulator with XRE-family HTH domain
MNRNQYLWDEKNAMNSFSEWLESEYKKRAWSISEFARQAGIAPGSMNHILNEKRNPGLDACIGIAKALNLSVDEVIRRLRPAEMPRMTIDEQQEQAVVSKIRGLGGVTERVLDYLRFLEFQRTGSTGGGVSQVNEESNNSDYLTNIAMSLFHRLPRRDQEAIVAQLRGLVESNERHPDVPHKPEASPQEA